MTQTVGIVGAGLVGCVTALGLQAKGFQVTLFELRPEPNESKRINNLKSINLAVSNRGIRTLRRIDEELADRIIQESVPMYGRMVHVGNKQDSQKYGLFGEFNSSIDRGLLNEILIKEVQQKGVTVLFEHKLVEINNKEIPELVFQAGNERQNFKFDHIIGTDGAHSQFRYQMQKTMRMNFTRNYIDMQYMELYIPAKDGKYQLDANHLHIWPRHDFMLIALPNLDGSFTVTFFSSWDLINSIHSEDEFVIFFKQNFADVCDILGQSHLRYVFSNQPRGSLLQIDSFPYNSPNNKALIIGDAAHLMVPFYGQGMNCGFEDVRVLLELLDANNDDLSQAFETYSLQRKDDILAICKLAMDNYTEMASKVTHKSFLLRKQLDYYLGKYANGRILTWIPLYSMISFRDDIPYSKAVQIEKHQRNVVNAFQYTSIIGIIGIVGVVSFNYVKWFHSK